MNTTGAPPPELAQDECHPLSRWLSNRPDARLHAREAAVAITAARLLAEQVLAMDLVTSKGIFARQLARRVLGDDDTMLTALRLIEHTTKPEPDDGGAHEAAHDLATQAIAKVTT